MRESQIAVFVHFVWGTWDRLPLLNDAVARTAYRAIEAKCRELKAEVVAIGGVEDHIHMLAQLPATLSVADLAKHAKGASSHLINFQVPGGGSFRWQGAYAAFSVDPRRLDRLIDYIAHQREHHHAGTIYALWEQPHDHGPPTRQTYGFVARERPSGAVSTADATQPTPHSSP